MSTNGNDTIHGTEGDDIINGKGGDDIIDGRGGDDQINGGSGNDNIQGNDGDDQLSGGSGNDTLIGGVGDDILIGGSGDDTAVINANGANGIGSSNGGTLTVTTTDGQDELTGIEHIQFNNGTVDIVNGNANAFLGADTNSISQQASGSGNVSSNDFDIDNSMAITAIHSNNEDSDGTLGSALTGGYGTLTLHADGSYSYQADAGTNTLGVGESAVDTFTYTVHSNGQDFTQTITITINGTNDAPDITSSASLPTYVDTFANDTFINSTGTVAASDVDAHDTLTYGIQGGSTDGSLSGFDTSYVGTYGTLYINSATGAYEYVTNDAAMEAAKTTVSETFTFTVSDGHGGTDSQSYTVTVDGVNDKPTLSMISGMTYTDTSGDDTFLTQTGTLHGADRDNDFLTYHATGENTNGVPSGFDHGVAGTYGTLYFNSSTGAYEYVPNDGAIEGLKGDASESFSFTASDGSLSSMAQSLTITLHGVNDTPTIVAGAPSNQLTEAGLDNGYSGTSQASATMTLGDRDTSDTPAFDTTTLGTHGWVSTDAGLTYHLTGTYGTAVLTIATGVVSYTLDNNASATQGLQTGDTVHDVFTLYVTDGTAGSSTTVDFTINGDNDAAIISGSLGGSATEAGGVANGTAGSAATGTVVDSDVDNAANTFQVVSSATSSTNGYGTYTIDAGGHWTFTVNDSNSSVQALNVGGTLTDTFTIHSEDGTSQTITVTINGANDAAVVSGMTSGSVTESGGALFSGTSTANGHLTDTDVDNTANFFQAVGTATATDQGHGTYTINSSGDWSFTLNNANLEVQALNTGDQITETFTVHTLDGTDQIISIIINGHNEVFDGTSGDNLIKGTIYGDDMYGGAGNDTYRINSTADHIFENANSGEDIAQASVTYTLDANVEDLTQTGTGNINGTGNELNNLIVGNNGDNVLSGMSGDDVIRGGAGSDTLNGGDGDDNLDGGAGNNTASYAGAGAAVTVSLLNASYQDTGGAGFDKLTNIQNLTGSDHDDTLTGDGGRNILTGGLGADTLTGGAGIDTFVYTQQADSTVSSHDTITDLVNGDRIDLSAIANDFTIVNHFTDHVDQITLSYNAGTDITTISIDTNGDGTADMQILANGDHHTFSNFIGLGV